MITYHPDNIFFLAWSYEDGRFEGIDDVLDTTSLNGRIGEHISLDVHNDSYLSAVYKIVHIHRDKKDRILFYLRYIGGPKQDHLHRANSDIEFITKNGDNLHIPAFASSDDASIRLANL